MQIESDVPVMKFRKFSIVHRTYRGKDGKSQANDFVKHPGAAVILPVLADGRIVMIRNKRPVIQKEILELPAGTLDEGETPESTAKRELTEETGYTAGKLEPLVSFYSTPGFCDEHMHVFLATELQEGKASPEETEEIQTVVLSYDDVLSEARQGGIADAKSLLTILFYDRFIRGQRGS